MILNRKSRRFIQFICLTFILIYHKDIYYYIYILTLNIEPYEYALTFWSSDYHISPIHDLKHFLTPLGVKFFDKSLSGSCSRTGTCYSPLRILTHDNGMNPLNEISRQFFNFYRNQIEMNVVDAFVCFHPVGMCELYMNFNRSLIIIASTRYELSRFERSQWETLNKNLIRMSQDPKNIIAANNLYDAEYIRYFTGINVTLLPSFCNYTLTSYKNPKRREFLLIPSHEPKFSILFEKLLSDSLNRSTNKQIQIVPIRQLYSNYQYSDLTNHPAIIHVPYQVSVMSLFEQYRMNIPLFFPSLDLLTQWHHQYGTVNEKTWHQTLTGQLPDASSIPGVLKNIPDPNNDRDQLSIRYWLNFSDFYQWPHIIHYQSIDDLVHKLVTTDFRTISKKMHEYNQRLRQDLTHKWKQILNTIKRYSKKHIH